MDASASAVAVTELATAIREGCHPTATSAKTSATGMSPRGGFIRNTTSRLSQRWVFGPGLGNRTTVLTLGTRAVAQPFSGLLRGVVDGLDSHPCPAGYRTDRIRVTNTVPSRKKKITLPNATR